MLYSSIYNQSIGVSNSSPCFMGLKDLWVPAIRPQNCSAEVAHPVWSRVVAAWHSSTTPGPKPEATCSTTASHWCQSAASEPDFVSVKCFISVPDVLTWAGSPSAGVLPQRLSSGLPCTPTTTGHSGRLTLLKGWEWKGCWDLHKARCMPE